MTLTHGSLFTGIGGFDLGFEWAGINTIWQVEIDEYCRRLLELRFPGARRYADIRAFADANSANAGSPCPRGELQSEGQVTKSLNSDPETPGNVDIISGGFPCQPVSHAGKRQGAADDRYLWPEMFRVVRTLRPRWVVAENVYGLITHEGGALLDKVYNDLEGEGYETLPPVVLPACAFGAPHRRDRVWIIAHAGHHSGSPEPGQQQEERAEVPHRSGEDDVAHAVRIGCGGRENDQGQQAAERDRVEAVGDPALELLDRDGRTRRRRLKPPNADWWAVEPSVGRVAHGIPRRVDRLRGLGNAIVPQIAYLIGRLIQESE